MSSLLQNSLCIALHSDDGIWATVGLGCQRSWEHAHHSAQRLEDLDGITQAEGLWTFRVFSYDLKDCIEKITPRVDKLHTMPMVVTVVPEHVIKFRVDTNDCGFQILQGHFSTSLIDSIYELMERVRLSFCGPTVATHEPDQSILQPSITAEHYHESLHEIRRFLQRGDIYEVNYCQEFEGETTLLDAFERWLQLLQNTAAPFAAYMQHGDWILMCASPERYMQRQGQRLKSQPIKGTAPRADDAKQDEALRLWLMASKKDRSENVMIVDLVRNDLSRIAIRDSVKVTELCGAYRFKTVHHLVSTIEATIAQDTTLADILRATFPMGSMTGAPKISAMQIAEDLESLRRGWYSGSIGFVAPNGNFDFNVIIRSAIYHRSLGRLSCAVGGAITMASLADHEYEESLLKAHAVRCTF